MKKWLIGFLFLIPGVSLADDLITTTLLDHVVPCVQFRSGETKIALVDSVVQIGSYEGRSLLDLQAGFNGEVAPEPGDPNGASLIAGAQFKVSSLINAKLHLPDQWEFLRSLEHGPFVNYDFREKDWFGGYQIGLAFNPTPIQ